MEKLLDLVDISGKAVEKYDDVKTYVSTGAVDTNYIDAEKCEVYSFSNKPSRANLQVNDGDIIFAKMQGTKKTLIIDKENEKYIYSTGFCSIKPKTDRIIEKILYYLLSSEIFLKEKDKNCTGATQKAITNEGLGKIYIKVPSISDQERLVKLLDRISLINESYNKQITYLDTLIKARFVEMFGDLSINSKNWEICKLSDNVDVIGGYAFNSKNFLDKGVPVLRIGNINSGYFKPINLVYWNNDIEIDKYAIYPGDLVISLTGTVGKDDYGNICILGDDYKKYYLNQRNAKLKINKNLNQYYLLEAFKINEIKKRLTGISRGIRQANISNNDILNLTLPIPPMELQNVFAAFVHHIDKLKFDVQKSLEKTQMLFDSLMQEYFG